MVAFGYDDCEGDLLERVRALVGADCVIGVEFDPHCHLTRRKCAFADIIILFKEYPHTDFVARGEEVVTLVLDAIGGKVKPVLSLYDCRTIASFPTTVEPMRSLVDEIMTPIIEVAGLKKHFALKRGLFSRSAATVKAVDGVGFTINPGETLCLVGESGCGKSTVGKLVLRLLEPTEGTIRLDGEDITHLGTGDMRLYRKRMK